MWCALFFYRQSVAPSVVGSLNEKDEKSKKAKAPIVIWPEWTEQDIGQEKWVLEKWLYLQDIWITSVLNLQSNVVYKWRKNCKDSVP